MKKTKKSVKNLAKSKKIASLQQKVFTKQVLFIAIGAVIFIAGGMALWASSNRGTEPTVWLKMDEGYGTTTYDSSGNGLNATLEGSTTWKNEEDCISGKCLYLDGSGDYISIPDFSLEQ